MRKYTKEDFICEASGEFLVDCVGTLDKVSADLIWHPFEEFGVDTVKWHIGELASLMAEIANDAAEGALNESN